MLDISVSITSQPLYEAPKQILGVFHRVGHQDLRELIQRLQTGCEKLSLWDPFPAALKFSCSKASAVSKAQTLARGG